MTKIIIIILILIVVVSMMLGGYKLNTVSSSDKTSLNPTGVFVDKQVGNDLTFEPEIITLEEQIVYAYYQDYSESFPPLVTPGFYLPSHSI